MANDQIKKADNGTYYFRANLGFDHSTGKRIQKYRSGFKTKKEAKEEYAKASFLPDSSVKTTSCSTHKKVSTILLYIYSTRKLVNIQDLYFSRRKDKILRLARSGRGLGQRPI